MCGHAGGDMGGGLVGTVLVAIMIFVTFPFDSKVSVWQVVLAERIVTSHKVPRQNAID